MSRRVLCVDDEPNVLQAYRRGLRKLFDIETAPGGPEGLEMIESHGPFAVVVSDMRMPGMDGVQFLASVKQKAPNSVRMMLTGNADQATAIQAVNEGNIFRFLTKPCPPEDLAKALDAGIEQYHLVTAEKELLGKTLKGSIKVLNDVLSLANPVAFGHASRVRDLVSRLCKEMSVERAWECEVAAMLSQIGCVTIPPDTLDKVYHGKTLSSGETDMIQAHPEIGRGLVANIPRLGGVSQIIAYQHKCFDGSGWPDDQIKETDIPLGARILKVALDYDAAQWGGHDEIDALMQLAGHLQWYDPEVLAALRAVVGIQEELIRAEIALKELLPGMLLADDVSTGEGMVVVAKGQEVTPALCQRIRNFSRHRRINEPILVLRRVAEATAAAAG
ncbi:MAG: HD domain-containing phosphohydrolase [Phycisphaerae bacterium]